MNEAFRERRFKVLSVPCDLLREAITLWTTPSERIRPSQFLRAPLIDPFPEDMVIISVSSDPCRQSFDALVCSKTFPVVPSGCMPEHVIADAETRTYKLIDGKYRQTS